MSANNKKQLVIIGAGPGGYAAAFMAADLGMNVTLIDPEENPGGVCLYRGCIPSKALLHLAKIITDTREAGNMGVSYTKPKIDIKKVNAWKNEVVQKLTGGLGQLTKRRNIEYICGKASFIDNSTIRVTLGKKQSQEISFEKAIIATGSLPALIPGIDLKSKRILDSTKALHIGQIPKSLLVIGGGYIGLELGTVYAALGSKVSVVEMMPGLLPGADRDLVSVLSKRISGLFDEVILKTKVKNLKEQKNGIKVTFEGDKEGTALYEKVLIAVGRKPNTDNIELENTKIETGEKGFVTVNEQRQTAEPDIYAIGDIAGEPMLAHKASHEGRTAVEAIAGKKAAFEPQAIPAVVFTDPEIAWCGLTENLAKEQGRKIEVAKFPWAASGRAATFGRNDGMTKLIIEPDTGRILGVGIAGSGAGELISEGVLAVEMAALVDDIELSIHPHPTLSETLMEAAESYYGQSTHYYRTKRKK